MIATKIDTKLTVDMLPKEVIPDLVHASAPCITLLLPPYRPGTPGETAAALLKAELQQATKDLAARKVAEPVISELLEPLRQLSQEEEWLAGSDSDRVIFRSREVFRRFALPVPALPARACTVGDCFWIRPILASLTLPAHVYVLEITKKAVTLLACGITGGVPPLELPAKAPRTLDAFLGFDPPDHDLMNRSAAGPSTGAMHGVQFGTGSGRETQHSLPARLLSERRPGRERTSRFEPGSFNPRRSGRRCRHLSLHQQLFESVGARHSRKSWRGNNARANSAPGPRHHPVRLPAPSGAGDVGIEGTLGAGTLLHRSGKHFAGSGGRARERSLSGRERTAHGKLRRQALRRPAPIGMTKIC